MNAVFDLTGWTRLTVTGADAAKFLQNFTTNDLLKAERGCETFFTSEKARVLGHGWLLKEGETIEFVGTPGQGPGLIAHLSKYALMEDVEFVDRTGEPLSYASSPQADGSPSGAFPAGDLLAHGSFAFEVPAGAAAMTDEARIAAKLPAVGTDLTNAHLAMEADRPWAICYTKGCYLGQEPVARVRALGRVNKLLRGLTLPPGSPSPSGGAALTADDQEVGAVTSAAGGVALGFLKRKWAEPGTAVAIDGGAATVV